MLVLSRHVGEAIFVGHDIRITVAEIRGDKVRIGITAPHDMPVHREEVYKAIMRDAAKSLADRFDLSAVEVLEAANNDTGVLQALRDEIAVVRGFKRKEAS